MIGAPLPPSAARIQWFLGRPSTDLAAYDGYLRFEADHAAYLDWVRRRGLALLSESGPNAFLPSRWQMNDEFPALSWWDATAETPSDAASGLVDRHGFLLAKHENGKVYLIISSSGEPATP